LTAVTRAQRSFPGASFEPVQLANPRVSAGGDDHPKMNWRSPWQLVDSIDVAQARDLAWLRKGDTGDSIGVSAQSPNLADLFWNQMRVPSMSKCN
jgi:hypothetical protein